MNIESPEILIESASARNFQMEMIGSDDNAKDSLLQIGYIAFLSTKNIQTAIPSDVAEFYNSSEDNIRKIVSRHRDEFDIDGLRLATKQELKALKAIGSDEKSRLGSSTRLTLWTPRSVLRLGMLLTKSKMAKEVRNFLIGLASNSSTIRSTKERELQLELELQKAKQHYQDTGFQIVQATSPGMLAFIRGEQPLVRHEIQYLEQGTGKLVGSTARGRILPQLVEDVGLCRNDEGHAQQVKQILKEELGVDFETGEGLEKAFHAFRPLVIPESRYSEFLYTVAVEIHGKEKLRGWVEQQQQLPDFLANGPVEMLPAGEE